MLTTIIDRTQAHHYPTSSIIQPATRDLSKQHLLTSISYQKTLGIKFRRGLTWAVEARLNAKGDLFEAMGCWLVGSS